MPAVSLLKSAMTGWCLAVCLAQPASDPPPGDAGASEGGDAEAVAAPVQTVIAGQVVDQLGRGVEGTEIVVRRLDDADIGGNTRSDSYGDFQVRIDGSQPGTYTVSFTKAGFLSHNVEVEVTEYDLEPFVDAVLQGRLALSGVVVAYGRNEPIAAATVRLRTLYHTASTETDDTGRFEFGKLIAGEAELIAEADGFGRSRVGVRVAEDTAPVEIVLQPERIAQLLLRDDRNRAVAGAAVELQVDGGQDYQTQVSDDTGRARFEKLPFDARQLQVRVTHADFVSTGRYDREIELPPDKTASEHVLVLQPAAAVTGRITSSSGAALNGARVAVGATLGHNTPHTFSNLAGRYEVRSLEPGAVVLTVSVAGHAPDLKKVQLRAGDTALADFTLHAGRTVAGRVLDPDGRPVGGAEVVAGRWRDYRTLALSAITDPSGAFVLEHAPPDEFEVAVFAPGWAPLSGQRILPDTDRYEFQMTEPRTTGGPGIEACGASVGDNCPPLQLKTLNGSALGDNDVAGRVVLLDFWATWCAPCVAEMPELKRIYKEYGGREDFLMIGVSGDFDKQQLEKFVREQNLKWPQVFGAGSGAEELSTAFGVRALPCTVLLGKDRKVLAVGLDARSMFKKIADVLQQRP